MGHDINDLGGSTLPALQSNQRPVRRNTFCDKNNNLSSKQPQQALSSSQDESRKKSMASVPTSNVNQPAFDGKLQVMNRIIAASSSPRNSVGLSQQQQYHLQPEPPLSARSKEEQLYSSAMAVSRSSAAVSATNNVGGRNSQKMVV